MLEAEHTLERFGAKRTMSYKDERVWVLAFEAGTRRFKLAFPRPKKTWDMSNAALGQAERERWRGIVLYLKATLTAVEAGFITLEDAFLAHTMLPDGGTMGEWAGDQLDEAMRAGQIPALLPGRRDGEIVALPAPRIS
jgi:hypothetical protein